MNLTVYIPRSLQQGLRERADRAKLTPARYLQTLLRQEVEGAPRQFSEGFAALSGSWEDDRAASAIVREIEENRQGVSRPDLS